MSLISRLFDAVRSLRRRPSGRRTTKRSNVMMEQLDHRQLLSVDFTGNVATDFPATKNPGVVVLADNPSVVHPVIAPAIQPLVKVSGFDLNGIRVSYDAQKDILSVGLEQPLSQQATRPGPVIAGDSDNNGNDGTVNPAVTNVPGFQNFQDYNMFGGSEYMGSFLDLTNDGVADVVAGYSAADSRSVKEYQVAKAIVNPNAPATTPDFGTELPGYEGNVYKVNSTQHPNLEFNIDNFSKLYLAETGKTLTANSVIGIGGFAGSAEDIGIGEAYFPEQTFKLSSATVPPPTTCPPVSPPITINPHQNRHINTAHPDDIKAIVLGSSGFDVTKIDPSTVRLGGAAPSYSFTRYANKDEWLDATFVFKGTDINLPKGYTEATLTGDLTNGQTFSSSVLVFNRNDSYYTPAQLAGAARRQAALAGKQSALGVAQSSSTAGVSAASTVATPTIGTAASLSAPMTTSTAPVAPASSTPSTQSGVSVSSLKSSSTPSVSVASTTTTPAVTTSSPTPTVVVTPPASSPSVASFNPPTGARSIRGGFVTASGRPGMAVAAANTGTQTTSTQSSSATTAATVSIPTKQADTSVARLNRRLRSSLNDFLSTSTPASSSATSSAGAA